MLAFTSKSNTLRLGRFRSWAVRPYLHKKVNTTFLTRCCLYIIAYLSAYMRLWGAWLVAYSVLFSRDRIIIHAFYWRFPLVKGRHSRYGLCWLSNHYVPCLSRVKTKREFLYKQTPIAYTTSRKFMKYSPLNYQGLKQQMQSVRSLSAQSPTTPIMHPDISGNWTPVTSMQNHWNSRAYARQLRHERRRASRLAKLAQYWSTQQNSTTPLAKNKKSPKRNSVKAPLPLDVQLSSTFAKQYWRLRRHHPTRSLKLRRRSLRKRVARRGAFRKLKNLSTRSKLAIQRKYVRTFKLRSPKRRARYIRRKKLHALEVASFLLPTHSQSLRQRRQRSLALLNLRRQYHDDYARYTSATRTAFAQRNYWHTALPQHSLKFAPQAETTTNSANWLRAYQKRTARTPSIFSHWSLSQFAQTQRTFNQLTRLAPKTNRHHLRAKHVRTTFGQRRFILGRSRLDTRRCLYPLRRRRHRKLALVTAANWRFAPKQTVPFIHIYRNAGVSRETDLLVSKVVTRQAQNYVKKTELRAANKAKRRLRSSTERATLRTVRTQRRNIRYYQQVELIAREMRRLRWRRRQIKRRKSTSVFSLARVLLHPNFLASSKTRLPSKSLTSLKQSTQLARHSKQTPAQASTPRIAASQHTQQLTNYLRVLECYGRRRKRRRLSQRKWRVGYNRWKRTTKRVRSELRRRPVSTVTVTQQIPSGRMLLPLPVIVGQLGAKMSNSHLTHLMISHALVGSLYNQTLRFFMSRAWSTNYTNNQSLETTLITNVNPNHARPRRAGTRYRGRVQSFSKFKMFQSYLGTRLKLALKRADSTFTQI